MKPGWTTSEFWMALIPTAIAMAVALGLVGPEQKDELATTATKIVTGVFALVTAIVYIRGRAQLKMEFNKTPNVNVQANVSSPTAAKQIMEASKPPCPPSLGVMLAIVLALVVPGLCSAQGLTLKVEGPGVKTVTVVESLPVVVKAPEGAALYLWKWTTGASAEEDNGSLKVTLIPTGKVTVHVKAVYVDFKAQKIDVKVGSVELTVGQLPNPPNPTPPPSPDDPVAKALLGAWQQEFAADKKDLAKKWVNALNTMGAKADSAATWGELSRDMLTVLGDTTTKLPKLTAAIYGQFSAAGFPASPSVLMDQDGRNLAKATVAKIARAVEQLP